MTIFFLVHSTLFIIQIKKTFDYFKDLTDILNILTQHPYTSILTLRKYLIYAKLLLRLCEYVEPLVSILKLLLQLFHFKNSVRSFEFEKTLKCFEIYQFSVNN